MLKHIISHIAKKIKTKEASKELLESNLVNFISCKHVKNSIKLILPKHVFNTQTLPISSILNIKSDHLIEKIEYIETAKTQDSHIAIDVNKNEFIKDTLRRPKFRQTNARTKNIIVEYSSPNIAKPFHLGNLRSTIIGNFLSNINAYLNNAVIRLNYLGDWGTQFGYLNAGLDILNLDNGSIEKDPIRILYNAYVTAHSLSEKDSKISDQARAIFKKLEIGDPEYLERWQVLKMYTVNELEQTYNRLGVKFDLYDWESMYNAKDIQETIQLLRDSGLLKFDEKGRQIVEFGDRIIPILKSDESSLYITRDIAAAIDRYSKFHFDQMFYVVDNAQTDHFKSLKYILERLGYDWASSVSHVKFGRVRGMSTRKGTAIFLNDILDEALELMQKKQTESPTTKVSVGDKNISDILGISCVIVNDLKQRRQRDYEFDWNRILQTEGDSGTKLQYTHCRLVNLEENCGVKLPEQCKPEFLLENETLDLISHLAKFYETIYRSSSEMEACILVNYLFQLCNLTSRCLKLLRVKNEDNSIAEQRLLLFHISRVVLQDGMQILGLRPLDKM